MIGTLSRRLATGSIALAVVAVSPLVASAPASASTLSAPYTCTSPIGNKNATVSGTLTATPNPATSGSTVSFQLHVNSLGFTAPVTVNSWTSSATLLVSGAENAQFQVTGSGGSIAANQAISVDLSGTWTPSASGVDEIRGGNVTINANVFLLGNVAISCTPGATQPVAETLTVS